MLTLSPKYADNEFFNALAGADEERLTNIIRMQLAKAQRRADIS